MSKATAAKQAGARRDREGDNNNKDAPAAGGKKHVQPLEKFDSETFRGEANLQPDHIILGIDEAGRGPAIGDMVYGAAMISLAEHQRLIECGVADSKALDEKARKASREKMERLAQSCPSFKALVLPISPELISEAMFGRAGHATLNTLSHGAAIALIKHATEICGGKLAAVFVDTVGPPATYERLLRGRFPHLHIRVSKKADAIFPVVSAASIFAKTDRDDGIQRSYPNGDVGSGYPSDERTANFLNRGGMFNRFFSFTSKDIRMSWAPVAKITNSKCVECVFEADEEKAKAEGVTLMLSAGMRQPTLSFEKQPPKRDAVFTTMLGFQSVMAM